MRFWTTLAVLMAALLATSCYRADRDLFASLRRVVIAQDGAVYSHFRPIQDANGQPYATDPGVQPFSIEWQPSDMGSVRMRVSGSEHFLYEWAPVEFVVAPPPTTYALTAGTTEYVGRYEGTDYIFVRVFEGRIFVFEPRCDFTPQQRRTLGLAAGDTECVFSSLDAMRRAFDLEQDENGLMPSSYYERK